MELKIIFIYSFCSDMLHAAGIKIETSFSSLTRLLPRRIDAVTAQGFIMKLLIFIFSFSLQKIF